MGRIVLPDASGFRGQGVAAAPKIGYAQARPYPKKEDTLTQIARGVNQIGQMAVSPLGQMVTAGISAAIEGSQADAQAEYRAGKTPGAQQALLKGYDPMWQGAPTQAQQPAMEEAIRRSVGAPDPRQVLSPEYIAKYPEQAQAAYQRAGIPIHQMPTSDVGLSGMADMAPRVGAPTPANIAPWIHLTPQQQTTPESMGGIMGQMYPQAGTEYGAGPNFAPPAAGAGASTPLASTPEPAPAAPVALAPADAEEVNRFISSVRAQVPVEYQMDDEQHNAMSKELALEVLKKRGVDPQILADTFSQIEQSGDPSIWGTVLANAQAGALEGKEYSRERVDLVGLRPAQAMARAMQLGSEGDFDGLAAMMDSMRVVEHHPVMAIFGGRKEEASKGLVKMFQQGLAMKQKGDLQRQVQENRMELQRLRGKQGLEKEDIKAGHQAARQERKIDATAERDAMKFYFGLERDAAKGRMAMERLKFKAKKWGPGGKPIKGGRIRGTHLRGIEDMAGWQAERDRQYGQRGDDLFHELVPNILDGKGFVKDPVQLEQNYQGRMGLLRSLKEKRAAESAESVAQHRESQRERQRKRDLDEANRRATEAERKATEAQAKLDAAEKARKDKVMESRRKAAIDRTDRRYEAWTKAKGSRATAKAKRAVEDALRAENKLRDELGEDPRTLSF